MCDRWERGDWTDDTDQLLLILRTIVKGKGRVDKCVFAKRMVEWRREGFRELGDYGRSLSLSLTLSHTHTLSLSLSLFQVGWVLV